MSKLCSLEVLCIIQHYSGPLHTDLNFPTLVSASLLKVQLSIAASVPTLFFLLLFLTVMIITCQVIRIRRKRRELHFRETVVNRHVDVLEILIERLPDDPSESTFMKLLGFIERILINSAQGTHETRPVLRRDSNVVGDGAPNNVEMEEFENTNLSPKSTALLRTLGSVIHTGMQNPSLRPHLDQQMSSVMGASMEIIHNYNQYESLPGHLRDSQSTIHHSAERDPHLQTK